MGHDHLGQARHIYVPKKEEIPSGLCECGCGKATRIATVTVRSRRHFRGHPMPFLHAHRPRLTGPDSYKWKGGKYIHEGYVQVYVPGHHLATKSGYALEHRLVMEEKLGRPLERGEVVHHLNHIKSDNRPENLIVLSHGAHTTLHAPERVYDSERMRAASRKGTAARWGSQSVREKREPTTP